MPTRVQRTRTKGQPGIPTAAKYVGRGTNWGNPARLVKQSGGWAVQYDGGGLVGTFPKLEARRFAVELYRNYLGRNPELAERVRAELRGLDLACWCPLPEPGEPDHCHAAVLLELANEEPR